MSSVVKYSMDFGQDMLQRLKDFEARAGIRLNSSEKLILSEIGTVEQMLSILAGSPIHVQIDKDEEQNNWATRAVWLCNSEGVKLLFAKTEYYVPNLPPEVYKAIHEGRGIGSALMHYNIDCRRRVIEFGYDQKSKKVWRKYEILKGTTVMFTIEEAFEKGIQMTYQLPAQ